MKIFVTGPSGTIGSRAVVLLFKAGLDVTALLRSTETIGQSATHRDAAGTAKFYPALLQRLAGPRAEPLRRSHRVSNAAFVEASGWSPEFDCLRGGWPDQPGPQDRPTRQPRDISERRLIQRGTA